MRHYTLGQHVVEATSIAIVCTTASYAVAWFMQWLPNGLNWLEVFAVFTSYACTWLCVRQTRWNYPLGAISNTAYAVVFWQAGLLGSSVLNAYLIGQLVYGWFRWRNDRQTRPVSFVQAKWWPVYFIATAAAFGGALVIWRLTDVTPVYTDIVILVISLLAQFLLDNKKLETWFFWAIVNVVAIYTYFHAGLPLAGFQYVFFLVNTIVGFVMWRRTMPHPERVVQFGEFQIGKIGDIPRGTVKLPYDEDKPIVIKDEDVEFWSGGVHPNHTHGGGSFKQ